MSVLEAPVVTEPGWLTEVRLRACRRMLWCRELWARHRYVDEDALAISHSEVERALATAGELLGSEQEFYATDEHARSLTGELEVLADQADDPRWERLCSRLALRPGERRLLALALAAELVPAMRRVYGYLQDETVALDPTPALVAELWQLGSAPRLDPQCSLLSWALARPADPNGELASGSTGWVADPLVLDHLLADGPATTPGPLGQVVGPPPGPRVRRLEVERIVQFIAALKPSPRLALPDAGEVPVEIELVGPPGSGRTSSAAQVAAKLGQELIAVDCRQIARLGDPMTAAAREARSARLADAVIAWQHADQLPASALPAVRQGMQLAFFTTEAEMPISATAAIRRSYRLPPLTRDERLRLWAGDPGGPVPEPVAEWALRPAEIRAIARAASAGEEAILGISRRLLLEAPPDLVTSLALPYTWDDLVIAPQLEAHLRELEAQARNRGEVLDDWGLGRLTPLGRGVSALFAGPSGTGKTMAAQVLARSLGIELYRVDLAGVVNKYIGETEKRLRAVFAACERAPVMLLFDEADALFGRRMQASDAHDRFANIEVDYLLQRMEQFDGLAVLATNRKGDLDTAFLRRLRFTIDFAPPTIEERERLWRLALEASTDSAGQPLVGEVDWYGLARELELTGAAIKSAALAAAFLARSEQARIETRHVLLAARRELEKQGSVVRLGRLEWLTG